MENAIAQHITKTPGVCGGRACIAGHRIRVQDIVVLHEMHGMSPKGNLGRVSEHHARRYPCRLGLLLRSRGRN
jgi:hypothetical protein